MFEKFLRENARDFAQRYEGTYGFFRKESGEKLLCRLEGIGDRSLTFVLPSGADFTLNANAEKDVGFEFLPPRSEVYNTDLGAMMVQRIAARQFQRGVSHRNIAIFLNTSGGWLGQQVDFNTLHRIYENTIKTADAFKAFEAKTVGSVAISPQLTLESRLQTVWLYSEQIGKYVVTENGYKMNLNDKTLFRTEISDAFKALNQKVYFI